MARGDAFPARSVSDLMPGSTNAFVLKSPTLSLVLVPLLPSSSPARQSWSLPATDEKEKRESERDRKRRKISGRPLLPTACPPLPSVPAMTTPSYLIYSVSRACFLLCFCFLFFYGVVFTLNIVFFLDIFFDGFCKTDMRCVIYPSRM